MSPAAPGPLLVVTGTGTGVGKTVVTAAVAALALEGGRRVAVLKPVQTGLLPGEPGDVADVARLAPGVTVAELARYPDPLAPETAARRVGLPPLDPAAAVDAVHKLAVDHDLVLVEGAGGLLVRFTATGTLADVAAGLDAPVLVVATAGLGTLNSAALTVEVLRHRGITCLGVVIGAWPDEPDLAALCNLADLPAVTGAPLLGCLPGGSGAAEPSDFTEVARHTLAPELGGEWHSHLP